jgi:hypothetical protein
VAGNERRLLGCGLSSLRAGDRHHVRRLHHGRKLARSPAGLLDRMRRPAVEGVENVPGPLGTVPPPRHGRADTVHHATTAAATQYERSPAGTSSSTRSPKRIADASSVRASRVRSEAWSPSELDSPRAAPIQTTGRSGVGPPHWTRRRGRRRGAKQRSAGVRPRHRPGAWASRYEVQVVGVWIEA